MEHTVTTLSNGRIILATIGERLSLDEWADVSRDIMEHVKATREMVHVVVDMTKTKSHPMNALHIKRVTIWANERSVQTINHVTDSRITSILGEVVIGLVASTYQSMKTRDEAFARIIASDTSISESVEELSK